MYKTTNTGPKTYYRQTWRTIHRDTRRNPIVLPGSPAATRHEGEL
ncbi:MAG: hypothetical protein ACJ78Q_00180 [Chloroflexia bacterium]